MSSYLLETIEGNLARRAAITSAVSSTESVVWVMKATFSRSGTSSASTSAPVSIRTIESGASTKGAVRFQKIVTGSLTYEDEKKLGYSESDTQKYLREESAGVTGW